MRLQYDTVEGAPRQSATGLRNEPGQTQRSARQMRRIADIDEHRLSESISASDTDDIKSVFGQVQLTSLQAMTARTARRHYGKVPTSSSAPTSLIKTGDAAETATLTTIGHNQSSHSSKQSNVITKIDSINERWQQPRRTILLALILIPITLQLGLPFNWSASAVSVQRLAVPDLVVIDQTGGGGQASRATTIATGASSVADNQDLRHNYQQAATRLSSSQGGNHGAGGAASAGFNQPEAASLITRDPASSGGPDLAAAQSAQMPVQQITFECLVSYDKRRDKNLIVKWHHDERNEPIYQWIPELNKRSIAPQYRPYIVPIIGSNSSSSGSSNSSTGTGTSTGGLQISELAASQNKSLPGLSLLEAGFKLYRPTKELGGKYTCSAISSQNDDSKSKKMIVYTPPRSFSFNASRANIGQLFASQRDRLVQLSQPSVQQYQQQLPLAYRMRGIEPSTIGTTISPQMLSTIDYVNVNQQRARLQSAATGPAIHSGHPGQPPPLQHLAPNWTNRTLLDSQQQWAATVAATPTSSSNNRQQQQYGIKLVCDIDQVFPVPEVSIYRLAKLDGSHPEKLAKLDTRIERDVHTGLFHVQVTSVLDADELQSALARQQQQQAVGSGQHDRPSGPELYFECLIALTNLELSRYADNRRSIIYRPASSSQQELQSSEENMNQPDQAVGSGSSESSRQRLLRWFKWHGITYWLLGLSLLATLTPWPPTVDLR